MKTDRLLLGGILFALASVCGARDLSQINPPFPRIGNCYAAGLGSKTWEQGSNYWTKLSLIIGGGYDLHYDWEKPRWPGTLEKVAQNIAKLRQVNPNVLVLPYVDVIEGPDNPNVPKNWWELKKGERWSGWPGMFRINTGLTEVLQFNLDKVREEICGRECFDGVFYDCWHPDDWLVPRTAALRNGKAVVMLNDWNLPRKGFDTLNGVLAEDEINRIIDGKVVFEEFLGRYLRWTRESRKPVVTMIVCRPQTIGDAPFRWHQLSWKERQAIRDRARTEDEKTMRFGLATTLMGDGYFGYDTGTMGRGNWWWYKEYDAPLGHPRGPARRNADGTWQRDYDGGTVVVNGTLYDAVAELPVKSRDVSTGRVGTRFTIPSFDGRIFLPTDEPPTATADVAPRMTARAPEKLRAVTLDSGVVAVQTPGGLEVRFDAAGTMRHVVWRGQKLLTGGWPVARLMPSTDLLAEKVTGGISGADDAEARLVFHGALVEGARRVDFAETCAITTDNRLTLHFDFAAASDLSLRMWRHYFAFPVDRYANAAARTDAKSITLPAVLKDDALLPASKRVVIETGDTTVTVESTVSLSLIDHRKHGSDEYLLAGYPARGEVKEGTKWSVEISVAVAAK
jgi:Hypothetical glycosyl hydrolase family 15